MWLADSWKDYEVLDTSAGEKLERWGKYILVRPDPLGRLSAGSSGSAGDLEHAEGRSALAEV